MMPLDQDQYAVSIHLVTMAGNEYTMEANLTHYEDITQLEDDILCYPANGFRHGCLWL